MRPAIALDAWEAALATQCAPAFEGELPAAAFEALKSTLTEYGSSRFGEYRRCQRAHALKYRDGLITLRTGPSLDNDYFGLGIMIHACLAYVWEGCKLGLLRDWRDVLSARTADGKMQQALYDETHRLVSAYFGHYGENDFSENGFSIVDVEREFTDSDSFDLPYTARLDLVVEVASRIFIVDTKTRATAFPKDGRAKYQRGLRTRAQFIGQAHLARRAYGLDYTPHVIVNAIVKTKIPSFDRLNVELTDRDVETWCGAQREAAAAGLSGTAMNYSSCSPDMGSACSYLDYCHGSDETRARHFTTKAALAAQPKAA
jgi:hypothetical protein